MHEEDESTEAQMEAREYAEAEEKRKQQKHDQEHGTGPRPEKSPYATAAAERSAELNKPTDLYVIFDSAEAKQKMLDYLTDLRSSTESAFSEIRGVGKRDASRFKDPGNVLGLKLEFSQLTKSITEIEADIRGQFTGIVLISGVPEEQRIVQHTEYIEREKPLQMPMRGKNHPSESQESEAA